VAAQITFFIIHYNVSDLVDSLVQSSLKSEILHPVILIPLGKFLLIQLLSYAVIVAFIWFLTNALCELFSLSNRIVLGCLIWLTTFTAILCLNNFYFPDSFFASLIPTSYSLLVLSCSLLSVASLLAFSEIFLKKKYVRVGSLLLCIAGFFAGFYFYDALAIHPAKISNNSEKPNIIFIGLDSVRPDFIHFFGNQSIKTPNMDHFLQSAMIFSHAYTPLARTFPAWVSILTGKYPLHNNARTNLADPDLVLKNITLAERLQQAGYETFYATDEKRFSNITKNYGFDHIIGPDMGVNDFILGGLSDFPLTNLLINSPPGRILFPYNYANRAAAITYEPDTFLKLVKLELLQRQSDKPLFLAIHLCVSHWPFTWARDLQGKNFSPAERYQSSVEAVDKQLGELVSFLQHENLLKNSFVVLLSDHGTSVGLPHDRIITKTNYRGDPAKLKWVPIFKLASAPEFSLDFEKDYNINTAYGQGTDVLSLKQYHVLLAIQTPEHRSAIIAKPASLIDIAPTVLNFFHLPSLADTDGISLFSLPVMRPLFIETGHSFSAIEKKDIFVEQVVKKAIGIYAINPTTGLLFVKPQSEKYLNLSKERAVLFDDWILARYPTVLKSKIVLDPASHSFKMEQDPLPAFFVMANLKTGEWQIGLDGELAKKAPVKNLQHLYNQFYGRDSAI